MYVLLYVIPASNTKRSPLLCLFNSLLFACSATDERDFLPTFVRQLVDTSSEQKSLQAKLVCVRQPDELLLVLAALKNAQPQVSIAYGMANAVIMVILTHTYKTRILKRVHRTPQITIYSAWRHDL